MSVMGPGYDQQQEKPAGRGGWDTGVNCDPTTGDPLSSYTKVMEKERPKGADRVSPKSSK